jgi:nucleoside-diphosphate-sugar epimerase
MEGFRRRFPLWQPSRVLVTGAAGFIGSHVVDALLAEGHSVVAVDRRSPVDDPIAAVNMADVGASSRLTLVVADLGTADLARLLTGCDTVFHLAAVPGVRDSWGDRFAAYLEANVQVTQRLLEACCRAGVRRMVVASSSSIYGPASGPSKETDPPRPVSPYAVTKLAAEHLCSVYADRTGSVTTVVMLRYFTVYGPRQRPDMAIGRVLASALSGVRFQLYGDGTQRRDFTHVAEVVDATIAAAQVPARGAVVINVGGGATYSMREVLRVVEEFTGRPVPVATAAARPGDVTVTSADVGLARRLLGYRPQVPLREGIRNQLDWLHSLAPDQRTALLSEQLPEEVPA